jgi:multiple sugar transport system substrate-binding protein
MGNAHDPEETMKQPPWSRRQFLRRVGLAGAGLAALPILAACGGTATATQAPAASAPAASSAAGSSAAASSSAGAATSAAASSSAAAASGSAAASSPAAASGSARPSGAAAASGSAAPSAAPPTPTVIAGIPRAKSTATLVGGKLSYIQNQDFHPDHNAFLRTEITEYCKTQGWTLDISYAAGFQGTSDLLSALSAAVQAGTPPDGFFQDIGTRQYQFQGVLEDTDDLAKEAIAKYGEVMPAMIENAVIDGKWYGLPWHGRAGGQYIREDWFKEAGIDPIAGNETLDKQRETALKISDAAKQRWGWGMTINRSGDGTSNMREPLLRFGMTVQDETGELVKFNSPETIAGFTWLKETYSDPKWNAMRPAGLLSWTDTSNNEAFLAGTIGITDNAGTMYAKAQFDKVPHKDAILFINRPKSNVTGKYIDSIGGTRMHIVKGTKNRGPVSDLMRHLLSDPVVKQLLATSPAYVTPAYKNLWSDPLIQNDRNAKAAQALAYPTEYFPGLRSPGPSSAAIDAIGGGTLFTDAMAEVLQGKAIPDVVKDYEGRMVQLFQDFGKKGR